MKYDIQLPNYDRSILSISSSIMKYYGLKSNYKSLNELDDMLKKEYKNIVFIILDCLGTNVLDSNLTKSSVLKKNMVTSVTTVFPPSTAAATTAFHSNLSPLESGWIGWMPYFKECHRAIVLFTGEDYYTKEQILEKPEKKILKYETIYEKICKKNKDVKFHQCFPSFVENGSNSFEEFCEKIKQSCDNEYNNLVSAYWDEPDHTIHRTGINSKETKKLLENIDDNLKKLTNKLDDTIIIISADHGAINLKEVYINEIKEINECLLYPPTIDSRFISFFIKKGMKNKFKNALKVNFKDKYILYTKTKFLKTGLLGCGIPHKKINEYLGDYIIIMKSDMSIRYATKETKKVHLADHSGITKEEMMVPLIVIDCKKNKE